jgi:hypothetical protein
MSFLILNRGLDYAKQDLFGWRSSMSRFGKRDVTEILELLEKELDAVSRLEKVEKMKLRAKIRHQENWLLAFEDPKPGKVILKLEGRLSEIFRLYPSSFKEKVGELLEAKCSKLDRSSPE